MSNKAKNSKESILCDAKELMKLYDRVTWHLPKARREHNAVRKFEDAGYAIIHDCTIAMELKGEDEQQRKREYVEHLIGSFGEMLAAFDILMDMKDMTQKKRCRQQGRDISVLRFREACHCPITGTHRNGSEEVAQLYQITTHYVRAQEEVGR